METRSPPTRGRGLKPLKDVKSHYELLVAPYAGARIETIEHDHMLHALESPPTRGARIETLY